VRLHRDVRIQMIECAVRLFAAVPATLVHALNLFVATTWSLVLLGTWDRNERVDLSRTVSFCLSVCAWTCDDLLDLDVGLRTMAADLAPDWDAGKDLAYRAVADSHPKLGRAAGEAACSGRSWEGTGDAWTGLVDRMASTEDKLG
jgi:hypothetical protein